MNTQEKPGRDISFDLLRIIAAFSVVVLHVSGLYISANEVGSMDFKLANLINSVSRFGVTIFVMISGSIFLSESKVIKTSKLWIHNILRMMIIFGVWSYAYYVYQSLYHWKFDFWNHGLVRTVTGCVYASDHFWFIFMIIGLYALVPFLRTWIHHAGKKELDYFVVLFLVFQVGRTTIGNLLDKSLVQKILDMVKIVELSWYLGYFVLGYIIIRYGVSKRLKVLIYSMVLVGIVANYIVSDYLLVRQGVYSPGIYDSFGIFTCIQTIAIFVFIRDIYSGKNASQKSGTWKTSIQNVIVNLSKDTLGIYLMHVGLLDFFRSEGIIIGNMPALPGIVLLSLLSFGICGVTAAILRRIPVIGRYMC